MGFISKEEYLKCEAETYNTIINNLNKTINLFFDSDELELKSYKTVNYKIIDNHYLWFLKNQIENNDQYLFGLSPQYDIIFNKQTKKLINHSIAIAINPDRNKSGLHFFENKNKEIKCLIRLNTNTPTDLIEEIKKEFKVRNSRLNLQSGDSMTIRYIDLGNIKSADIIQEVYKLLNKFNFDLSSKEHITIITEDNQLNTEEYEPENIEEDSVEENESSSDNSKICKICNEEKELHEFFKIDGEYEEICKKCFEKKEAAEYLEDLLKIYRPETCFNQTEFLKEFPEKEEQINVLKENDLLSYDFENDECLIPDSITIHKFEMEYKELIPKFNENQKGTENKTATSSSSQPKIEKTNKDSKYTFNDEGHIKEKRTNQKLIFTVTDLYKIKFLLKKEVPLQKISNYIGFSYANINNYKKKINKWRI